MSSVLLRCEMFLSLLVYIFITFIYASVFNLDAEVQGPQRRGSTQPESGQRQPVPPLCPPRDHAAAGLLPQLHLRSPGPPDERQKPRGPQLLPPSALAAGQAFLLWPPVDQLPLPGPARRRTVA